MRGAANEHEAGGEQQGCYLVLEDLTQGMRRPCVMDIKIGAQTYGPDASPAKQRQEDSKYLGTKKPLGIHCQLGLGRKMFGLPPDTNLASRAVNPDPHSIF